MHTILRSSQNCSCPPDANPAGPDAFCQPNYDCKDQREAMKLVVYLPGVEAAGVDIEASGDDLRIVARKAHLVRVNWQALHLECAQRDYQLKLRLGSVFDYAAMTAEFRQEVLTITLPKRPAAARHLRNVA